MLNENPKLTQLDKMAFEIYKKFRVLKWLKNESNEKLVLKAYDAALEFVSWIETEETPLDADAIENNVVSPSL